MRTLHAVVFSLCAGLLAVAVPAQDKRLTLEDVRRGIRWVGSTPMVRWTEEGDRIEALQGKKRVLIDPATLETEEVRRDPERGGPSRGRPGPEPAAREAEPAGETEQVLRVWKGDLWLEERAASDGRPRGRRGRRGRRSSEPPAEGAVRLTEDGGSKRIATLAPGRARASFVRDGNLVVLDTVTKEEWRVTGDGSEELLYGVLDWVYQEEIYGRGNYRGHWWSPDGARLAFLRLDETPVKEFTVVNHVPEKFLDEERAVQAEVTNYPKAGDPNPTVRLGVADAQSRQVKWLDLGSYDPDILIARVEWTPDGDRLLFAVQDRIQTWADLCAADPATGEWERWFREESETWVNRPGSPRWLESGGFLWESERTGYNHVYRYGPGGELAGAVTGGEWQVQRVLRVDEELGVMWFEGTRDGALDRHAYRVGLDGSGLTRLTEGRGRHRIELDRDGSFFLDTWSAMDMPPKVRLCSGDGEVRMDFGEAGRGAAEEYAFSPKQRLTIPARDGYELDASLVLPTEFDPGERYPIYLPTYSGPDSPSVREGWSHSTMQQFLAQQGCIVLQVNVRSASGRGQKHTGMCYRKLGVTELRDLEDAVDYVVENHSGDPERVAITGWSYGGFMAAFALTHSEKFSVGIAGAGVYDWRLYDTIYTERYMSTPQENPEGYDATSVIKAAKDLHGHLAILHGLMDDNVHVQNAIQLVWALQSAGKTDFEMMLYPRSRHGLHPAVRWHRQQLEWRILQRELRL